MTKLMYLVCRYVPFAFVILGILCASSIHIFGFAVELTTLHHDFLAAVQPTLSENVSFDIPLVAFEIESLRSAMPDILFIRYLSAFCNQLVAHFKH